MRLCHVLRNAVHLIHDLLAAWLFCTPIACLSFLTIVLIGEKKHVGLFVLDMEGA